MSKFFRALEQAERDRIWERQAGAPAEPADVARPVEPAPEHRQAVAVEPEPAPERRQAVAVEPEPAPERRPYFPAPLPPRPARRPIEPLREAPVGFEEHLVSLVAPTSPGAEQYRVLRHVVETLRTRASLQIVAVTSPTVGDGKTTTAINLAGSLAESADARVLLVDLDLRRPAVAHHLGLNGAKPSLVDALRTGLELKDAVVQLSRFNLSVLPAPPRVDAPYELLRSPKLEALLEEARHQYDFIVVDTPPFVPVPDCRLIARCVDGFLVVVGANRTPRGVLAETLSQMDAAKAVGLVFNGQDTRHSHYYSVYAPRPRRLRWLGGKGETS